MNHNERNDDLSPFERQLQGRQEIEPSAALKSRVMRAVGAELRISRASTNRPAAFLSFSAGLAAALLIALNLSITVTSGAPPARYADLTPEQISAAADALQQCSPDLTRAEAVRASILMQAAGRHSPLPSPGASMPISAASLHE